MTIFPRLLSHLQQLAGTLLTFLVDTLQSFGLRPRLSASPAAENLSLRKPEQIPLRMSTRTIRRW